MYDHQYEALKRHVHFYLDAEEGPLAGRTELHVEDFKVSKWVLGGSRQLLEDAGLAGVEVQKDYHSEGLGLKFMKDGEQIGSAMVSTDVDAMLDADLFEGEDFEDEDPAEIDRTNMTISDYYVHEIVFLRPGSRTRPIRWDEMDGLEGQARKHREFDPDKFSQYMNAIRLEDFSYTDGNGKEVDAKHGYGIWLNETGCEISAQDACSGTLRACQAMADIRFPGDFPGKAPTVQMGDPDTREILFMVDGKQRGSARVELVPDDDCEREPLYGGMEVADFELGNFTWNDLKKLEDAAREAKMAQECSEFADSVMDLSGDGGRGIE